MMKIKAMLHGREVLILGLSHGNLDKLRADGLDGYIKIDGGEIGIPFDIMITAGESEATMLKFFQAGIGPGTKLHIDDKVKIKS